LLNMRSLDLNLLVVFESIYSAGNISHAARQLDMSQPAMSNALARLRKQLDDQLFVRAGNGVVPTPKADAIAGPIRDAIQSIQRTLGAPLAFDPATSEHNFRLICADPMEPLVMPQLARAIQGEGSVSITLLPPQTVQIEEALYKGDIDAAIFIRPAHERDIVCDRLFGFSQVFLVREGHPALAGGPDIAALKACGQVILNLRAGALANSEKVKLGERVNARHVCLVNRIGSIPPIVAGSDLVGIVPDFYARMIAKQYGLRIVQPKRPLEGQQMFLIWHQKFVDDPAHIWLREVIQASVQTAIAGIQRQSQEGQ
jgi:LysR family transcriptional regulator, transcriptional activator for leuABCD operon